MPPKRSYEVTRKYRSTWESEFPWVRKDPSGTEQPFCTLCRVSLAAKRDTLVKHQKSETHSKAERAVNMTKPLRVAKKRRVGDDVKEAEIMLAVSVACHSAISTVGKYKILYFCFCLKLLKTPSL